MTNTTIKKRTKQNNYKITKPDKAQNANLWAAQSEVLVALLSVSLKETRNLDPIIVCTDLNYTYLRKRSNGNKKNYGPTRIQRAIIRNEGY